MKKLFCIFASALFLVSCGSSFWEGMAQGMGGYGGYGGYGMGLAAPQGVSPMGGTYIGPIYCPPINTQAGIGGMEEGVINNYNETDSPIKFTLFLSYSFSEDFSDVKQGYANFYVSKIIAAKRYFKGMLSGKEISTKFMDNIYPGWNTKSFFLVEKNR